jgi:NlpC/P60 family
MPAQPFSLALFLGISALLTGPCGHAIADPEIRSGPWGHIEISPFVLSPVTEILPGDAGTFYTTTWFFSGHSTTSLTAYLSQLDLTGAQRKDLLDSADWVTDVEGISITPLDETIFSMRPDTRSQLYRNLSENRRNDRYYRPWSIRTNELTIILDMSGLTPETKGLLQKLMYEVSNRYYISDSPTLLNAIHDRPEQERVMRMMNGTVGYMVKLRLTSGDNIDSMLWYWGGRGRENQLRPIIDSFMLLPGGGLLDISYLLPDFARIRLNTFPDIRLSADGVNRDCHWSSLNFYSSEPNNQFAEKRGMQKELRETYEETGEPARFGDIVFFEQRSGTFIHSAVYLAANLVFTKNGSQLNQPWIIMDIDNLREFYNIALHDELTTHVWRKRLSK